MAVAPTIQRGTLNLRIKPEERGLVDRAAALTGKTPNEFALQAAQHAAEQAMLDRTVLHVSQGTYAASLAKLDEVPKPNDRLRRTMQAAPP